jgi:hypothetical protein
VSVLSCYRGGLSYFIWKAGVDRFAVSEQKPTRPVLGYIASNHNGSWSVERQGQTVAGTFCSIDAAVKALITLSKSA